MNTPAMMRRQQQRLGDDADGGRDTQDDRRHQVPPRGAAPREQPAVERMHQALPSAPGFGQQVERAS